MTFLERGFCALLSAVVNDLGFGKPMCEPVEHDEIETLKTANRADYDFDVGVDAGHSKCGR